MTDEQLKRELGLLLSHSRGSLVKRLRDGTLPELSEFIIRKTDFMDDDKHKGLNYSWLCRIYCVIHSITDFPKCSNPNCKNKIDKVSGFLGEKQGFRPYCSKKCGQSAPDVIRHRMETCMAECGATTKSGLTEVIEKGKATREKNGTLQSITCEKARETRYKNNDGKWHAADFGEKVKAGKVRNGHAPTWNNPEKRKVTLNKTYGVDNTFNIKSVRDASRIAIRQKSYEKNILNCQSDEPLFSFEEYADRTNDNDIFKFRCKKCGNVFESAHHDGYHKKCPLCYPKLEGISREEIELRDFIKSCFPNEKFLFGSRQIIYPKELDIYLPSRNIAVEFDGLFWHCDANLGMTRHYHLDKTDSCSQKGIRLIHVFEDEWREKRPIVESRLKNILGIYDKTVYARKCAILEVDSKTSNAFLEENHLQGGVNGSVRLGLFFKDELVALMTFGKCRFDKKHEWEMLRFCTKLGYHIPGAAGKLLKHFEITYRPMSLVTYADRRWSEGGLYLALGFAFERNSPPNYWYVNNDIHRYSRIEFQKHKLKDKLKVYDNGKTEVENMKANGYFRIFDCGNMVFKKEYKYESV